MAQSVLSRGVRDPDLWWHLAAGRALIERQEFIRSDLFSHTMAGAPWVNFEWLSQIFFYGTERFLGIPGLFFLKFFLSAIVIMLFAASLRKAGARGPLWLFLTLLGFVIIEPRLSLRPEIFTWIFFSGLVYHSVCVIFSATSRSSWHLGIFFFLMIVWVNCHGGFIYGLGFLFLLLTGLRIAPTKTFINRYVEICFVLGVSALFINPSGIYLISIFIEHLRQLFSGPSNVISEWSETSLAQSWSFWLAYIGCAVGLVMGFKTRLTWWKIWVFPVAIFAIWGTMFVRNTPLFAFVGLSFLAGVLVSDRFQGSWLWLLALWPLAWQPRVFFRPWPAQNIDARFVPVRASQFIDSHRPPGFMYNTYHYGGYLAWSLGPDIKIFWDGRYIFHKLMDEQLQVRNQFISGDRDAMTTYLSRYQVTYTVIDPDLAHFFPLKDWALVFWDDAASVYLRRIPAMKSLINRFEYHYARPSLALEARPPWSKAQLEDLRSELERSKTEVGFTYFGFQMEQWLQ